MRLFRRRNGVTQEQLAEELGLTHQQVQKYERGVSRLSAARLHEIAGLLGVPVACFFPPVVGEVDATLREVGDLLGGMPPRLLELVRAYVTEIATLSR